MKKFVSIFLFSIILLGTVAAQEVVIKPFGVSPRDAVSDSADIYDRAYNALLNVGVETKMFLDGIMVDSTLSGTQSWTLTSKPAASNLTGIDPAVPVDASRERIVFIPDAVGQYVITFTDGALSTTVEINAGLYKGVEEGCLTCHSATKAAWENTGHASMLQRGLDGTLSNHYASYCIGCHTVGYDTEAANDGFDDRPFVFPDTLFVGQYNNMVTLYPEAMKLANIQCESCHGPASEHFGNTSGNRMTASLDAKNCAWCHDSGTHHFFPAQWEMSGHSKMISRNSWSGGCAQCHTPEGFIEFTSGEEVTSHGTSPLSCAACHDPHSDENVHQLRTMEATLGNDQVITEGGTGVLCMNCHRGRREANSYSDAPHNYYGPHYMTQADVLNATNVVTFGIELPTSPHAAAVENTCAGCHMAPAGWEEGSPTAPSHGGHTFNVVDADGNDRVEICADCHGDIGTSFDEKVYYFNGEGDHDGDGTVEGLQSEVEGLMETLAQMLPHNPDSAAYDPHDNVDDSWTTTQLKAAFNYEVVYYDRSKGIHNPAFTVALLKVSIAALIYGQVGPGTIEGVMDVPNDQGKKVNVSWTRFGGDGISDNPIDFYGVWRLDPIPANPEAEFQTADKMMGSDYQIGDQVLDDDYLLTYVGGAPAAGLFVYNVVAPTIFNTVEGDTVYTGFVVSGFRANGMVDWSEPGFGYSLDNLIPVPPAGFAGSQSDQTVQLGWLQSEDVDFQYYAVYRSETPGFDPSSVEPYATTINNYFEDNGLEFDHSYYYRLSVFDFNGNESQYSAELGFTITGVDDESGIPTKYDLYNNYPNPFNPTTQIKYALPEGSNVKVVIYDGVGREITVLENSYREAGYYTITWNASNLASGIYFYKITANDFVAVKKMLLIK